MRHALAIASLTAALAGLPLISVAAVETPTVTVPAVNVPFLNNLGGLSSQLVTQAEGVLDLARKGASLPFASDGAKAKVAAAQGQVDTANSLKNDVASLAGGHKLGADSLLSQLNSGTGPSLSDRFSGLPLASTLQTVLGNKEILGALMSFAPLNKVPGYAEASQALAAFAP